MSIPKDQQCLALGNQAFYKKDYPTTMRHYIHALLFYKELTDVITFNIHRTRKCHLKERGPQKKLHVAVCGWELSHNAAGRVYTLAQLYQEFADVEIIGALFQRYGEEVWKPIRNSEFVFHTISIKTDADFLDLALDLVLSHPYDLIHLSKPRIPNIFFGILYKMIWGSQVIIDIDDEELAFVNADSPLSLEEYLQQHSTLPFGTLLDGPVWTRLAVGLVNCFDGITVVNPALQQRYGGEIIRHARDEKAFRPSAELTKQSRQHYGIPEHVTVVLFCGTPRKHKGLIRIAQTIAATNNPNIWFVIVGDFDHSNWPLKTELLEIPDVNYHFLTTQPFKHLPEVTAMADVMLLPQDNNNLAARFQTPAKLSDALAMGVTVLANPTPGNEDLLQNSASLILDEELNQWQQTLNDAIQTQNHDKQQQLFSRQFFLQELSIEANQKKLHRYIQKCNARDITSDLLHLLKSNPALYQLAYSFKKKS